MTADDYELAEAALAASDGSEPRALRMLRDECGWTLRQAHEAVQRIKLMAGRASTKVGA